MKTSVCVYSGGNANPFGAERRSDDEPSSGIVESSVASIGRTPIVGKSQFSALAAIIVTGPISLPSMISERKREKKKRKKSSC
jgi:hypothetical protein